VVWFDGGVRGRRAVETAACDAKPAFAGWGY
jgi:hypothetical protein